MHHFSNASTTATTADFSGLWVPLVTPFRAGAVDHVALAALARRLGSTGIAGLVVCGSTGEAAALDDDEKLAVLDTVAAATPELPRMMGLAGEHLGHTLSAVRRLASRPLAALLVPPPSYIRPSQDGLHTWFAAIADASGVPIVVYDIPYRTGSTLALSTMRALAEHPRIQAVKDCGGDAGKTRALLADGRLQMLAGEDAQIFSLLCEGGTGAIAASAHLHTDRFVAMMRAIREERLADARGLWQALVPLIDAMFAEPNPAAVKALLAHQGDLADELRAPMTPASAALRTRLLAAHAAVLSPR
ncbi:4-hydroxy-tetrahydrodipicolinate synthase family protein [Variovorax ginsengisoli]|uniref:4-hydroxy-tetrahydrodipicolinate synthase n=1 Tax=Variovorax ginsengisoli TaxID=363844 RepID=A0ABT9S6I4_9BURK|nr:4-hydroxy-tetrahydrodipicolinate synthase [Variovorax ginsengisoli]MDP9899970.1 4-hydroxy-tetrahydrodipicolinate synthase [Variovorax ginsengisoli]